MGENSLLRLWGVKILLENFVAISLKIFLALNFFLKTPTLKFEQKGIFLFSIQPKNWGYVVQKKTRKFEKEETSPSLGLA